MQAQVHARTLSLGSLDDCVHGFLLVLLGLVQRRLLRLELLRELRDLLILALDCGVHALNGLLLGSQLSLRLRGHRDHRCILVLISRFWQLSAGSGDAGSGDGGSGEGGGVLVLVDRCLEVLKRSYKPLRNADRHTLSTLEEGGLGS